MNGRSGSLSSRPSELHSSGTVSTQRPPDVEDLRRPLDRPEEAAGIDLGQLEQLALERHDRGEVAPAAANRPEQVGLVLGVGVHAAARRR